MDEIEQLRGDVLSLAGETLRLRRERDTAVSRWGELSDEIKLLQAELDYARKLLMDAHKASGDALIKWDKRQERRDG